MLVSQGLDFREIREIRLEKFTGQHLSQDPINGKKRIASIDEYVFDQ